MKISKNKNFKEEYCSTCVRIGEIFPIEGKDRIVKTLVNGLSIVIGKDDFKTGDVAVYVANECVLNSNFLYLNNMYDSPEMNQDTEQRGYVNKHGRVRCIKLGGVPSYGMLLTPTSLSKFTNESVEEIAEFLEKHVNEDFDEINGERFVHVYVPPVKVNNHVGKGDKKLAKLKKFDMMPQDTIFRFHYDTKAFAKEIHRFNPDDVVDISVKLHGTSAIFSNIITNMPTNWFKRMWRKFVSHTNEYDQNYNLVYSSRTVIKNQFINPKQKAGGYYSNDVWGYWANKVKDLIPKDYCVYGEIVGYTPNGSVIQKGYDYGCVPGESKLMIYRITVNGKDIEIPEVIKFGEHLKLKLGDEIISFPLLYRGTLKDLYPDVDTSSHWHENVLESMKLEKKFLMEKKEPMCNNKVPREGIVIRKENDVVAEAFKLKTYAFAERERSQIDAGEVDIEMVEGYSE